MSFKNPEINLLNSFCSPTVWQ